MRNNKPKFIGFVLCVLSFYSNSILAKTVNSKPTDSIQVSSGKLVIINDFSSKIIRTRTVLIWLPDEYFTESSRRFPVTYMHDGQMLFDSNWTWNHQEWGMDELIAKSQYKSIVVGIFNDGKNRSGDYFPEKPWKSMSKESQDSIIRHRGGFESIFGEVGLNSDEYLKFLVDELKPYVDKNFRTLKEAKHTIIGGASMGGLISWYALCEYPKVFGNAICLSTHWPGSAPLNYDAAPVAFQSYLKENLPKKGNHRFFFARGTGYLDSFYKPFQESVNQIFISKRYHVTLAINQPESESWSIYSNDKNGLKYEFQLYKGHDHKESAWQIQMIDAWRFISDQR